MFTSTSNRWCGKRWNSWKWPATVQFRKNCMVRRLHRILHLCKYWFTLFEIITCCRQRVFLFFGIDFHPQILKMQYDSDGDGARHLYYHFVDKHAPDILISQIPKSEANDLSFEVSGDYKYLILCNSRVISVANIERIDTNMTFKVIFSIVRDAFYVSSCQFWFDRQCLCLCASFFPLWLLNRNTLEIMGTFLYFLQMLERPRIMSLKLTFEIKSENSTLILLLQ